MQPLLPGLSPSPAVLLDEQTRPDFRDVFRALACASTDIASAVTRVRLSALDFGPKDFEGVESLRVIVTELNALTLDAEARFIQVDARRAPRIEFFRGMLEEGRLEVRSSPLGGWSPNFTVFSRSDGPHAVLTGRHWFERPYPLRGPALACLHSGDPSRLVAKRHLQLWERAHDVGPALWSILSKAERHGRLLRAATG